MKPDSNTILLIVAALLVAAGAYWYFFTGGEEEPSLRAAPQNEAQMQFKLLVSELQPISFNTNIFSDARFMSLVDLATPLTPETPGRLDPFAVIPGVIGK